MQFNSQILRGHLRRILIDGPRDIRKITLQSFGTRSAPYSRRSILFSAIIYEIIGHGSLAPLEEIIRAAKLSAGAHEFIANSTRRLNNTYVGEGVKPSGGQSSGLASLEFPENPPVPGFLDEATSALDNEAKAGAALPGGTGEGPHYLYHRPPPPLPYGTRI